MVKIVTVENKSFKGNNKMFMITAILVALCIVSLGACRAEQTASINSGTIVQSTPIPEVPQNDNLPSPTITQITAKESINLPSATITPIITESINQPTALVTETPALSELTATPESIRRLLNVCVDQFWWSLEGDAVYYVDCQNENFFETTGHRFEEGPVWRLDLSSGEVNEVEDAWPPEWVPRQYQAIVPETIPPWLISVSPSGKRVVYLEEIEADIPDSTPEPNSDPMQIGPEPFMPRYLVHAVLENGNLIELGMIDSFPDPFTWSEDEELVFIPSYFFAGPSHEGWLLNLEESSVQAIVPPGETGLERAYFMNASILPNGEAILYRPYLTEPFYIWNYTTNDRVQLKADLGIYTWLEDNRSLIFSLDGLYFYDVISGNTEILMDETMWPSGRWKLSPKKDSIILTKTVGAGLWLVTLNLVYPN